MAHFTIEDCVTQRAPGRMLRRLEQDVKRLLERRFAAEDVTVTQWIALRVVQDAVGSNPGELARELNITTGATTRLIDTLEARGLLMRDRSAEDRRIVGLRVTAAGETLLHRLAPIVVAGWNELVAEFDEAEVAQFSRMLTRMLAVADRMLKKDDAKFAGEDAL